MFFHFFPDLEEAGESVMLLSVGLLAAAFICMPLVLRVFLGLRSMPASLLRDRLEKTGRRLHFRFSDILVWNTHAGALSPMQWSRGSCPGCAMSSSPIGFARP